MTTTARSFGAWLKKQDRRADPVGDLAADFLWDCRSRGVKPSSFFSASDVCRAMQNTQACVEAFEALGEAEREFLAEELQDRK